MAAVELWLRFTTQAQVDPDEWVHMLSIPAEECQRFSVRPLKWLRFLGYTICGCEGDLFTTPNGQPVDYEIQTIPQDSLQYYFSPDGVPRFVDPTATHDRLTTSTATTARRQKFRKKLIKRDTICVMTGEEAKICQAYHILPFSKGDDYIQHVIHHRLGKPGRIKSINSPRNGLLLVSLLHNKYGFGKLSFLKTPNLYLSTEDIPFTPPPDEPHAPPPVPGHYRLTLQYFEKPSARVQLFSPHNSDARQLQTAKNWPPDVILDFSYASIVMKNWGLKDSIAHMRQVTDPVYYHFESPPTEESQGPGGPRESEEGSEEGSTDDELEMETGERSQDMCLVEGEDGSHKAGGRSVKNHNATDRQKLSTMSQTEKRKARNRPIKEVKDAMDIVMFFWKQSARAAEAKCQMKAEANNREKVHAWLGSQVSE